MTKAQAVKEFNKTHRGMYATDKPALREAWGIYIYGLLRAGEISAKQYDSWDNPF